MKFEEKYIEIVKKLDISAKSKENILILSDKEKFKGPEGASLHYQDVLKSFQEFEKNKSKVTNSLIEDFSEYLKRCVKVVKYREAYECLQDFFVVNDITGNNISENILYKHTIGNASISYIGENFFFIADDVYGCLNQFFYKEGIDVHQVHTENTGTGFGKYAFFNSSEGIFSKSYDEISDFNDKDKTFVGKNVSYYSKETIKNYLEEEVEKRPYYGMEKYLQIKLSQTPHKNTTIAQSLIKIITTLLKKKFKKLTDTPINRKLVLNVVLNDGGYEKYAMALTNMFLGKGIDEKITSLIDKLLKHNHIYEFDKESETIEVSVDGFHVKHWVKYKEAYGMRYNEIVFSETDKEKICRILSDYISPEYAYFSNNLFSYIENPLTVTKQSNREFSEQGFVHTKKGFNEILELLGTNKNVVREVLEVIPIGSISVLTQSLWQILELYVIANLGSENDEDTKHNMHANDILSGLFIDFESEEDWFTNVKGNIKEHNGIYYEYLSSFLIKQGKKSLCHYIKIDDFAGEGDNSISIVNFDKKIMIYENNCVFGKPIINEQGKHLVIGEIFEKINDSKFESLFNEFYHHYQFNLDKNDDEEKITYLTEVLFQLGKKLYIHEEGTLHSAMNRFVDLGESKYDEMCFDAIENKLYDLSDGTISEYTEDDVKFLCKDCVNHLGIGATVSDKITVYL